MKHYLTAMKPVDLDLSFIEFKKPDVINLDKLDIRVPYGDRADYTIMLNSSVTYSKSLKDGLITLLINVGTVNTRDPAQILKQIEKYPGENGKKLIRGALDSANKPTENNEDN